MEDHHLGSLLGTDPILIILYPISISVFLMSIYLIPKSCMLGELSNIMFLPTAGNIVLTSESNHEAIVSKNDPTVMDGNLYPYLENSASMIVMISFQ